MPFEFTWHDEEHSIIRVIANGETSWGDFTKMADRVVEELAKATHRIDIIFDVHSNVPKGNPLPQIRAANRRMSLYRNRVGLVITVGPRNISSVIKVMVDITMRVYKLNRSHLGENFSTLDEALEGIKQSREKAASATTVSASNS